MQTKLAKYVIKYPNEQEYHHIKNEIFTNNCYYFQTNNPTPLIIDVGTYIGISLLYFKREYPDCKVICFEPNPIALEYLNENIFNNGIENVEIHNSAIWVEEGFKQLNIDNTGEDRFSVASFNNMGWNGTVKSDLLEVKTEKLDQYLNQTIDLLKLDIEGAEQRVLKSIGRYFKNIKNIIIEFHPTKDQDIKKVLEILKSNYEIEIYNEGKLIEKNIPTNRLLNIKAIYKK
jgi:FkbM family methyltransferase